MLQRYQFTFMESRVQLTEKLGEEGEEEEEQRLSQSFMRFTQTQNGILKTQ